ncbi:MAG TPA: hypothetical protein VFA33_21355 [Bryobacteraceae bacterium]|nr:hypothetical protein [Bryobacteraceae bacterium]
MLLLLLLLSSAWAAADEPEARSWTPEAKTLPSSLTDADPQTLETFCQGAYSDPMDVGLSWRGPQRLGEFTIEYATLGGRAYQPSVAGQQLEAWTGAGWRAVPAELEIDYREQGTFGPVQGSGTVRWRYRFAPLQTTRLRLLLTQPENEPQWQRCYGVRGMRATGGTPGFRGSGVRVLGERPRMPAWLAPGANLATPEAGARITAGKEAEVRWPRRLLVNRVEAEPGGGAVTVEWWDGAAWRAVESVPAAASGGGRFLPVSTERLKIRAAEGAIRGVRVYLDAAADRYFREIERGRADLLGARFRGQARPDLAGMQGLLLPLDFAKAAIGRPADLQETMVTWNGEFFMVEAPAADRWFAFAASADQRLFGSDWPHTRTRYLDGWLPATVTTYTQGGFRYEEQLWVTAPGTTPYGTAAEVRVTNEGAAAGQAVLTLAMGRRPHKPPHPNPLSFAPELTGYKLDADGRTVRNAAGEIILRAETAGAWEGTPRENHLRYTVALGPRQSRTLRFFAPSVEAPVRQLAAFDWAASREQFRSWWQAKLSAGTRIELPELGLNDIYKNLLAQALIITLDGDSLVRYGAYSYESYFGLEEGWPAVALAQFGHKAEAQEILSIMLSPALMDKKNYHHQYRNGLEAWYAATIYRLTGDRAWLEKIAPDLEAAAEWTIRTIHANTDAKYGGILPRHAYGGDIHTPAYSLYANATCWRGLQDTALVFRALGRSEAAERYQREADQYRRRLWELADSLADHHSRAVFLPMSFEIGSGAEYREKEPSYGMLGINVPAKQTWEYLGNYWNLFAPCFLELNLFEKGDPRFAWVADYMDARGGVLAGLARFTLGLDQIYGKGYYENLLARGKRDEFLTSLYGILAHGMSQDLNSFPEVAGVFPLRASNAALWREYQRNFWDWGFQGWEHCEGEPLSAGPGMALQMLRMALVRETIEDTPQDSLRLLDGAPAHWFEPGKRIVVRDAPTFFGRISLETEAARDHTAARLTRPPGFSARQTILRLPDPAARPLREVTVNGQPWRDFSGDEIRLPAGERLEIVARR